MLNEDLSFNRKASDRSTEPWHPAPTLRLDACQLHRIMEKDLKLEFSEEARRQMDNFVIRASSEFVCFDYSYIQIGVSVMRD